MTRILITGKSSYIGTSFERYMKDYPEYEIDMISVRGDDWKEKDFSSYDVVFHVAGLAHQKETKKNQQDYYDINYELTKEIANKAKSEGVAQFIFLSSMSIYGIDEGVINKATIPNPKSAYGKSKLMAERYLESIENSKFKVAIVRPPMVYGPNCPGNYKRLSKLSSYWLLFPRINNKRSIIYVVNLSRIVHHIMLEKQKGIILARNQENISTDNLINQISDVHGKRVYFSKTVTRLLMLVTRLSSKIKKITIKIYGDLYYEGDEVGNYRLIPFKDSIMETEKFYEK